MHRIAPPPMLHLHGNIVMWLNNISLQWKLREMSEPHTLTLDLLGKWREYKVMVGICRFDYNFNFATLKREPSHQNTRNIIDDVITRLTAELEGVDITRPQVTIDDIEKLWECQIELDKCRESYLKY